MPYVKSRSIHATVNKSIAYILDPKKTDGMLLTTSINCTTDAHDAYLQMKMIYEHYSLRSYDEPINKTGKTPVKAIHYIMSFADSENVTPEYAQKVAMAFVKNTFGEDVQAVIATHTNTTHTHCHVILNLPTVPPVLANSISLGANKYVSILSSSISQYGTDFHRTLLSCISLIRTIFIRPLSFAGALNPY